MLRICAGVLALALAFFSVCGARGETGARSLYRRTEERQSRHWWGVLYGDALLLARAEEGEDSSGSKEDYEIYRGFRL